MIKNIRRSISYARMLKKHQSDFRVLEVNDPEQLLEAQKLHASVYLERGYIETAHLNQQGIISLRHDPYQVHSVYFGIQTKKSKGNKIIATARLIKGTDEKGHKSFPTIAKLKLDPSIKAALHELPHSSFVEVSALAKARGYSSYAAMLLYRAIWQYAVRNKYQVMLMSCDAAVYSNLKFLFGEALTQIGPKAHYMGSDVIPAILEVDYSLDVTIQSAKGWNPVRRQLKRQLIRFFTRGLPARYFKAHAIKALKLGQESSSNQ